MSMSTIRAGKFQKTVAYCVSGLMLGALILGCAATSTTESPGEYLNDAAITAKVKIALDTDPKVMPPFQIQVQTFRGVVQLSGFIDSNEAVQAASRDASRVAGVRRVENDVIVKTEVSGR